MSYSDTGIREMVDIPAELAGMVDENGFLRSQTQWTPEVATWLGRWQGLESLSGEHWKVIDCLRGFYQEFGVPPPVKKLCRETGLNLKQIYALFPSGLSRGAIKIAGLPKPRGLYPQ